MTAISISRIVIALSAIVAAGGAVFAIQYVRQEPPADARLATAAPAIPKPASNPQERSAASLAKAESETKAVMDALIGFGAQRVFVLDTGLSTIGPVVRRSAPHAIRRACAI